MAHFAGIATLVHQGEQSSVAYEGDVVGLKDSKDLRQLAPPLKNPNQQLCIAGFFVVENRARNRLMRFTLSRVVGAGRGRNRAVKSGYNRLDECVAQHLAERLPCVDVGTDQFSLEVNIARDLIGTTTLEQV